MRCSHLSRDWYQVCSLLTCVVFLSTDQQYNNTFPFSPNQQVGVNLNHDLSYDDQSARRKRSKVSRACDECRRKKVRSRYSYNMMCYSILLTYGLVVNLT